LLLKHFLSQSQVFQGLGALTVPGSIGQAATTAGDVAQKAGQMSYGPGQFDNQFNAPGAYQTGDFSNQFNAPGAYQTGQFASQYQGPDQYQAGQFRTGTFGADQAQQYMSPYIQSVIEQQQRDADANGFIGSFHKNHRANLLTVCESCHNEIHHSNNNSPTNVKKPSPTVRKKTSAGGYILE
jgi:hypothetical protein